MSNRKQRKAARVTPLVLALVVLQFAVVPRPNAVARSTPPQRSAKISFPKRVGAFARKGAPERDAYGYPMSTYWAGAVALASVFYYQNEDHSLVREYAECKDQVKIASPSAKLLSDRRQEIPLGGAKHQGYRAVFALKFPWGAPAKSQLIIFRSGDYFLKFRITYPLAHAERAEAEIDRFLSGLPWPGQ